MTALPTLKLRVLPTFPASVTGAGAITVTKAAGAYTIGFSQDVAMTWTQPHVFNPTNGDAITITPKANSTNKSIISTQTTPTSGTVAGPFALNLFNLTYSMRVTGSGTDSFGLNNVGAVGFRVNQTITSAGVAGTSAPIITGLFAATVSTTTAITDVTGLAGTAYTNVAMSGAFLEGLNGVAQVGPAGSANILVGGDFGAIIQTGGTAVSRLALSILSGGSVNGTTLDAAIAFVNNTTTKFNKVFAFTNVASTAPVGTSTDVFYADTAYSIANFANLGTMDISGNVLLFSKVGLSGDGRMILGGNNNVLPTFPTVLQAKRASGGSATLASGTNITTGFSGFDVLNSTSTLEAFLTVNEAARTAVHFGQTIGGWSELGSTGGNGMVFGTLDATPLIIGTNNTARMRVTGAGLVNIGTDVAPAAGSVLTINKNAASPLAAVTASPLIHAAGTDSTQPAILLDSYAGANAGNQGFFVIRKARGTAAAATAVQSGDALGYFGMVGANANGAFASEVGAAGGIFFGAVTTQLWSASQAGCELRIYTTPNGSTTIAQVVTVQQSGGLSVGTTTDGGAGTVVANANFRVGANQVAGARVTGYTAMTGSPDKASAYATGSVTLAQLAGRVAQLQADLTTHGLIGA